MHSTRFIAYRGSKGQFQDPSGTPNEAPAPTPSDNVVPFHFSRVAVGKTRRFTILSSEELALLPDPEWLLEGMMPEDALTMLYGEPGGKKSLSALDLGAHIATGLSWHGRKVRQVEVVYIYSEGIKGLKARLAAWEQDKGQSTEGHLHFVPAAVDISSPRDVADLIASIEEKGIRPGLIIIDTLARNFGSGDENSAKDMNAFVAGADRLRRHFGGATVEIVHHSGKDKRKGGRGSSVLLGAVDTAIFVVSARKSKTGYIECEKQKDGDCFGRMNFQLRDVGKSVVLDWFEAGAVSAVGAVSQATPMSEVAILKALENFPNGAGYTELLTSAGVKKRTFDDAINRMITKGKITKDDASKLYRLSAGAHETAPNRTTDAPMPGN